MFWHAPSCSCQIRKKKKKKKRKNPSTLNNLHSLYLCELTETTDGGSRSGCGGGTESGVSGRARKVQRWGSVRDSPCSAGNSLLAGLALPDSDCLALHSVFAAKGAGVPGVLGNLHFLDLLTERGTVSGRTDEKLELQLEGKLYLTPYLPVTIRTRTPPKSASCLQSATPRRAVAPTADLLCALRHLEVVSVLPQERLEGVGWKEWVGGSESSCRRRSFVVRRRGDSSLPWRGLCDKPRAVTSGSNGKRQAISAPQAFGPATFWVRGYSLVNSGTLLSCSNKSFSNKSHPPPTEASQRKATRTTTPAGTRLNRPAR